jgi:hypothetical protein
LASLVGRAVLLHSSRLRKLGSVAYLRDYNDAADRKTLPPITMT